MGKLARASIRAGDTKLILPVNPYTANWGYQENAISRDTIGGRVVQLLSVQVTELTVESVAGSRRELQKIAESTRQIMAYHVRTLRPAIFHVPSRNWNFHVYVTAMPQMGWDVGVTSYPYQLTMQIDEDISGVKTKQIEAGALKRLFEGVGYSPAVHGGDPTAFNAIVENVLAASATTAGKVRAGGSLGASGISGNIAQKVVDAAQSQIGVPYSWAASNPAGSAGGSGAGFDCSGLTSYCYQKAGITIPHQSGIQHSVCQQKGFILSRSELEPGDLVFFFNPIHHVGIYVGNGEMIDAPHSGANVRKEACWWSSFNSGGRPYRHDPSGKTPKRG